jgi:predicted NAD-dependent protein-ADP-ribosyltransferase YbiA (DUF1768 family)
MNYISFTKVDLPYGWLGNMSPYPVTYDNKVWRTTEALFQALRFNDEEIREAIRNEKSPMGAKLKAKSIMKNTDPSNICVTPLSDKDLENMKMCVKLKLEQHPHLVKELKETGKCKIYEDVSSRGKRGSNLFWGSLIENGSWVGQNHLGNIWEEIRDSY